MDQRSSIAGRPTINRSRPKTAPAPNGISVPTSARLHLSQMKYDAEAENHDFSPRINERSRRLVADKKPLDHEKAEHVHNCVGFSRHENHEPHVDERSEKLVAAKDLKEHTSHATPTETSVNLYNHAGVIRHKREETRKRLIEEEQVECTFTPAIHGLPNETEMSEREKARDFLQRENEWEEARLKRLVEMKHDQTTQAGRQHEEVCTFSPRINDHKLKLHGGKPRNVPEANKHTERLERARQERADPSIIKPKIVPAAREKDPKKVLARPYDYRSGMLQVDMGEVPGDDESLYEPSSAPMSPKMVHTPVTARAFPAQPAASVGVEMGTQSDMTMDAISALQSENYILTKEIEVLREQVLAANADIAELHKLSVKKAKMLDKTTNTEAVTVVAAGTPPSSLPPLTTSPAGPAATVTTTAAASNLSPNTPKGEGKMSLGMVGRIKTLGAKSKMQADPAAAIQAAAKDIPLVQAKLQNSQNDSMRLKAATDQVRQLFKNVKDSLAERLRTEQRAEKRAQLELLLNNLEYGETELANYVSALRADPNNNDALAGMARSLVQLQDTADLAASEGTHVLKPELRETMMSVPMFRGLENAGFFNFLARRLRFRNVPPRTPLVTIGEPGDSMFFVTKGTLSAYNGANEKIGTINKGQVFGEIAVLTRHARTATVKADNYVDVYELDHSTLSASLNQYPMYKEHFEKVASARLHEDRRKSQRTAICNALDQQPSGGVRTESGRMTTSVRKGPPGRDLANRLLKLFDQLIPVLSAHQYIAEVAEAARASLAMAIGMDTIALSALQTAKSELDRAVNLYELRTALSAASPYRDTGPVFIDELVKRARFVEYEKDATVITRGLRSTAIYFILSGTLLAENDQVTSKFERGYAFDEALNGGDSPMTLTSITSSMVGVIDMSAVQETMNTYPDQAAALRLMART